MTDETAIAAETARAAQRRLEKRIEAVNAIAFAVNATLDAGEQLDRDVVIVVAMTYCDNPLGLTRADLVAALDVPLGVLLLGEPLLPPGATP